MPVNANEHLDLGEEQSLDIPVASKVNATSMAGQDASLDGAGWEEPLEDGEGAQEERRLSLVDGHIQLPCRRPIVPGGRKYNSIISQVLPDEAPELLEALKAKQDKPSRLARIALVAGLALSLVVVFCSWPDGKPPIDTSMVYDISTRTSDWVDEKYRSLLEDCNGLWKNGKYLACAKKLEPYVNDIFDDSDAFLRNARLLSIYLNCNKHSPRVESALLVEWCDRALQYDDSLEWQLDRLFFSWQPYMHVEQKYKKLLEVYQMSTAPKDRGKMKEKVWRNELERHLDSLSRDAEEIRAFMKNNPGQDQRDQTTLDKLACQIFFARWIVEGYSGYPDDKNDLGVDCREKAYEIAKEHEDDLAFLEIRKEIAEDIKERVSFFDHYYFDGREHKNSDALTVAIADIHARISKAKQP